ncbi:MAG: 4Fe-4S cluster-binding domain-containing protein, partial [Planctomycetes bacterium]|nr:4Fe-4S cluster-binding domain-containing protein [Planctomycetota bacterium]
MNEHARDKQPRRSIAMPVKYWSRAGLLLTYWCNARCASCYLSCNGKRREEMPLTLAMRVWRELIEASPHGCKIHLSGGEPFRNWPFLIELCRQARRDGLAPLEKIETNAFWAIDENTTRRMIRELDDAGMEKLVISTDAYHQQYVPIERCRLAARIAEEVLGPQRVRVRWRKWLEEGFDTNKLSDDQRRELFASASTAGRDRFVGRAARELAPHLSYRPWPDFSDMPCRDSLLRSKHVHIGPEGMVMPGTCAGITLGSAADQGIADIRQNLIERHGEIPLLAALTEHGPTALLDMSETAGFVPRAAYASKCHLCWDIRTHLVRQRKFP